MNILNWNNNSDPASLSGGSQGGPRGPDPPSSLFLDQTGHERPKKKIKTAPPPYLRVWGCAGGGGGGGGGWVCPPPPPPPPPPPNLKVAVTARQTGKGRWVNSGSLRGVAYVPSLNFLVVSCIEEETMSLLVCILLLYLRYSLSLPQF